jgi:hypothetical protein
MARFLSRFGGFLKLSGVLLLVLGVFAAPNNLFADEESCYTDCETSCAYCGDDVNCYDGCVQPCFNDCAQGGKVCSITQCTDVRVCYWWMTKKRCSMVGDPDQDGNKILEICRESDLRLPCKDCICDEISIAVCNCKKP